jgi:hypothetical protein
MWALRCLVAGLESMGIPTEITGVITALYAELTHVDVVCSGDEAFALVYDGIYRVVRAELRTTPQHEEFSGFVSVNTWEKVSSMRVTMRAVHTWHCMVSDGVIGLIAGFCKVPIVGPIIAIACGGMHSMVLTNDGLFGFGHNAYGQLGTKQPEECSYDIRLVRTDVVAVACGEQHTFIITSDGSLRGCGHYASFASMTTHGQGIGGYNFYKIGQASAIRAHGNTSFVCRAAGSYLDARDTPRRVGISAKPDQRSKHHRWSVYGAPMVSLVPEYDRDDARDILKRMVTPPALADLIPAISRARGRIIVICLHHNNYIVATRNGIFTIPRAK